MSDLLSNLKEKSPSIESNSNEKKKSTEPKISASIGSFDNSFQDISIENKYTPSYEIVPKSIYKTNKSQGMNIFSRYTKAIDRKSALKYEVSALPPDTDDEGLHGNEKQAQLSKNLSQVGMKLDKIEVQEDIQVISDTHLCTKAISVDTVDSSTDFKRKEDIYCDGDSIPQVVIHSTESDSVGYATINPILMTPNRGGTTHLHSSTLSTQQPVLVEIPAVEMPVTKMGNNDLATCWLVVLAEGAANLLKVEKFGVQSAYLELQLLNEHNQSITTLSTAIHKKCGTEAHWDETFTIPLPKRDPFAYTLHFTVKTANKLIIGKGELSLQDTPEDTEYIDLECPLGREVDSLDQDTSGQVQIHIKILTKQPGIVPSKVNNSDISVSQKLEPESQEKEILTITMVPQNLRNGGLFYKLPYHTRAIGKQVAKRVWLMVCQSMEESKLKIVWENPTSSSGFKSSSTTHSLDLSHVTQIRDGPKTKVFERFLRMNQDNNVPIEADKCFSLVTRSRSLDLVAPSKEEAQIWTSGLRRLLFPKSIRLANKATPERCQSARLVGEYRDTALLSTSIKNNLHISQSARGARSIINCASASPTSLPRTKKEVQDLLKCSVFQLARTKENDYLQQIAEILNEGCPVDVAEVGTGHTLLLLACEKGDKRLVELCLSRRAKNDPHPEFGSTALQIAVKNKHASCLELLLEAAAKSNMDSEIANHIDGEDNAPIHVASRQGDLRCIELLFIHGADVCVVDGKERTPLHCAALHGHHDCVAYLIDAGGDSILNAQDCFADTALHLAVRRGSDTICKLLCESAADVFITNSENETPYDVAKLAHQVKCMEIILPYYISRGIPDQTASRNNHETSPIPEAIQIAPINQSCMLLSPSSQIRNALSRQSSYTKLSARSGCDTSRLLSPPSSIDYSNRDTQYASQSDSCTNLFNSSVHNCNKSANDELAGWDVYTTNEGYEYYINQQTGVSQWEKPTTQTQHVTDRSQQPIVLSPDAIIRLRLAEVRKKRPNQITSSNGTSSHAYNLPLPIPPTDLQDSNISPPKAPFMKAIKADDLASPTTSLTIETDYTPRSACSSETVSLESGALVNGSKSKGRYSDCIKLIYQNSGTFTDLNSAAGLERASNSESSVETVQTHVSSQNMETIRILDNKRASNILLVLSQFKYSSDTLLQGIKNLDDQVITIDILSSLKRLYPSDAEVKRFLEYEDSISSLSPADAFLYQIVRIPFIQQRMDAFQFKLEFGSVFTQLKLNVCNLKQSCRDLVENYTFCQCIQRVYENISGRKSFHIFQSNLTQAKRLFQDHSDEKLRSFTHDLEKVKELNQKELHLQLASLSAGLQSIKLILKNKTSNYTLQEMQMYEKLQAFLYQGQSHMENLETDYFLMKQWEDKLLQVFGEKNETCDAIVVLNTIHHVLSMS